MKKEEQKNDLLRRYELPVEELEDVSGGKLEDYITSDADLERIKGILLTLIKQGDKTLSKEECKAVAAGYLFLIQSWYPNVTQQDLDDFIDDHYNEVLGIQ